MDTKKTEIENSIAKIKTQQEIIAGLTTISTIDIDVQLDYIRNLYENYIAVKQELTLKKLSEEKLNSFECRTLPLFDDLEEENREIQEKITPTEQENIPVEIEELEDNLEEKNGEKQQKWEDIFSVEENVEQDLEEKNEEIEENETFEEEEEIEEEEEFEEEEEEEEEFEEEEEEEEEEDDDDDEENMEEEVEEKEEEEEENETETDSFTEFPEVEMEINIQPNSDIDIDDIEFEIEEDIDNEEVARTEDTAVPHITHIGTAGQPRYWGDELDIEPMTPQPTSVGDRFISNKPSLNEIVSGFKPDESIGMRLQHTSVSDLMKSIDMNLKFLFVKNLFKGNGSLFTEEINKINAIGKLQEALTYVEEMKNKYNWDDKSEAYSELHKLVLRKYAR